MFSNSLGMGAKCAIVLSVAAFINLGGATSHAATLSAGFSYNNTDDVLKDGNKDGLSWLNLNETRGLSQDEVSSKMGAGGDYEGYRYATGLEVNKLIGNWLGTTVTGIYNTHAEGLFDDLIMFIGDTWGHHANSQNLAGYQKPDGLSFGDSNVQHFARGILADAHPIFPNNYYTAALSDELEKPWAPDDFSSLTHDYVGSTFKQTTIASFLVQTTPPVSAVPLPAGLPLYGAGLALMGFIGWRKKRSTIKS